MRDLTSEATLEDMNAWGQLPGIRAVRIQRYQADNGRYSDPMFL